MSASTSHPSDSARTQRLLERFEALSIDALLVVGDANRRYLSGFAGTAGILIITAERRVLVTDFRYTQQAQRQAPAFEVIESVGPRETVTDVLAAAGARRVGFEANHTTYAEYQKLREAVESMAPQPALAPVDGAVELLRRVKDSDELATIREAVRIADDVMAVAADTVRPGITERAVADRLEAEMKALGADEPSFPTIVAAGPNAAMAHHSPGGRPIGAAEPVIVDLGVRVRGYCSDITRTFHSGDPDEKFQTIYATVLNAQLAAEDGMRAGLSGRVADGLARDVIAKAGFGERFGHGTGHGVGLEIHEGPRVSTRSDDVLEAGTVTSVEPGIYLPEWGGVRIEDLVLVNSDGVDVLTRAPK